jgi:hypothetical protein
MKKKLLIAAAVAAIASVPAVTGLLGNASFVQSVPVHVPAGARTIDDHSHHAEPGDDRGRHAEPGDDRGRQAEPGDDRGATAEPGDDRGGASGSGVATTTGGPDDAQSSGSVTT